MWDVESAETHLEQLISHEPSIKVVLVTAPWASPIPPGPEVHSGQPAKFHGLDALHQHPRCPNQSLGPEPARVLAVLEVEYPIILLFVGPYGGFRK